MPNLISSGSCILSLLLTLLVIPITVILLCLTHMNSTGTGIQFYCDKSMHTVWLGKPPNSVEKLPAKLKHFVCIYIHVNDVLYSRRISSISILFPCFLVFPPANPSNFSCLHVYSLPSYTYFNITRSFFLQLKINALAFHQENTVYLVVQNNYAL